MEWLGVVMWFIILMMASPLAAGALSAPSLGLAPPMAIGGLATCVLYTVTAGNWLAWASGGPGDRRRRDRRLGRGDPDRERRAGRRQSDAGRERRGLGRGCDPAAAGDGVRHGADRRGRGHDGQLICAGRRAGRRIA